MDIYVDSANLDEIKSANALGLCDGVTTNPTLLLREGTNHIEMLQAIADVVEGPVHGEVLSLDFDGIMAEAKELAKMGDNIIVKIPMFNEGLKAVKALKALGIKTNVTLIFSASQAILAAKAGASYVCPFLGRLDDISADGLVLLSQIRTIFDANPDLETGIIAASIRTPGHVVELAQMGIDILTIPAKVLGQMEKHPLTASGIAQFTEDAKKFK